ncbi:MAG: DUF2510 domain-containing protein [Actinomycetes bacterium]
MGALPVGFFSKKHVAPTPIAPTPAQRLDELQAYLSTAMSTTGVRPEDGVDVPIALKKAERMLFTTTDTALIEPRRLAGHYQGASQGVSIRVPGTKSMRYRVGSNRGTFVQGDEVPTPIDIGNFTVTDQRAVFAGAKQTREWSWAKLVSVQHQTDSTWTAISVSNRQKTSGVMYGALHAELIRFWIDLAVARATDIADEFVQSIRDDIVALGGVLDPLMPSEPAALAMPASSDPQDAASPPPPVVAPTVPDVSVVIPTAQWAPDPHGRFELRWWDGSAWTSQVSAAGKISNDPLG